MTDTDRLLTWLREVMDAAEGVVKALPSGPWRWEKTENDGYESLLGADGTYVLSTSDAEGYQSWIDKRPGFDGYLQLMQPAAVLRRIAAERKLLDLHTTPHTVVELAVKPVGELFCSECDGPCTHKGEAECELCGQGTCDTVRLLAEAWGWTGTLPS